MKYFVAVVLSIVVIGCSSEHIIHQYSIKNMSKICIEGVVYYVGSGYAPAFKKDGTLYTCESEEVVVRDRVIIK